jgi:hypothetical protein
MSSDANVLIRDRSQKTTIMLRMLSEGATTLRHFVWLPLHHARFIRAMRPDSVAAIKERFAENASRAGEKFALTSALHHFDEMGHLFGVSTEYLAHAVICANMFNCVPLAKQKHAWGMDELPVVDIITDYSHFTKFELGKNRDYPHFEGPEFMKEIWEEIDEFNLLLASEDKFNVVDKLDPGHLILEKTKNGYQGFHNCLVIHILTNDLDRVDK